MSDEGYAAMSQYKREQREKKRNKSRNLFEQYEFEIIKEVNNITTFIHDDITFYFTEVTATVREQGSKIKIPLKDFLKGEY
jgi:hypothetical protein